VRILVVTNLFPSPGAPAFGTFVGARVRALGRAGVDVRVAAITNPDVHRSIASKYLGLAWRAVRMAFGARLRGRAFDVVEAHIAFPTGIVAWPAARIGSARLVLFAHGSDVLRLPWRSRLTAAMARWAFRRADLVVTNSAFISGEVRTRFPGLRRDPIVVSPGVQGASATDPSPPAGDRVGVAFVGRLVPAKGLERLIDALAILPPGRPELVVAGDGPERARLEARAHARGVGARFLGSVPPAAVAELLDHSLVLAVPSIAEEGLGLAAIEGMLHGSVVLATRAGGLAEVVTDGIDGITVEAAEPSALASALSRALALAEGPEGDVMRAAGRATAAGHDLDAAVAATLRAFDGLR
jgi:glycosyltransferase involved in cell wall biosynthesis